MLTDTQIRNLKPAEKAKKYADGGGLFLYVAKTGSKLWRMAYYFERKEKVLSFGEYPMPQCSMPYAEWGIPASAPNLCGEQKYSTMLYFVKRGRPCRSTAKGRKTNPGHGPARKQERTA